MQKQKAKKGKCYLYFSSIKNNMRTYSAFLLSIALSLILIGTGFAFVTSIHAPAVITNENKGTLTIITLNLTSGNGTVTISGPVSVGVSTLASAREAVAVASSYLGINSSHYNFSFAISDKNVSVSGPSAGLAFTLLTVSAFEHKPLLSNFTVSGEIVGNGSISLIGGVYDKAEAASSGKMRFFLLPNASAGGTIENLIYYISQSVFRVPIVQVNNLSESLPYAFGNAQPEQFFYNVTQHYLLSNVPVLNLTCSSCNESLFDGLANFTLNFTKAEINSISSNFSSAKQQMLANEQRYLEINSKGYAYTAADLAFLQYLNAFVLANKNNYTAAGASSVLNNISNFCSSLQQPMLTNTNYEYAIGGEFRQELANITLAQSYALLNSSETTSDTYIESLYSGAEALGWCKASQYMYNISNQLTGNYVGVSGSLKNDAAREISNAEHFGSNLYLEAAIKSYDEGNYPVALYAATYADVLGNPNISGNMTNMQLYNATLASINTSYAHGIWPYQFAAESLFYLHEYKLGFSSDLQSAYQTSQLASALAQANKDIESSFTISNVSIQPQLLQQLSSISSSLQELLALVLVLLLLMFAVFVILLIQLVNSRKPAAKAESRRQGQAHRRRRRRTR
ncbi:MAG: S16 family serine protease [Candidatus Micrarchaeaceae archaeon]